MQKIYLFHRLHFYVLFQNSPNRYDPYKHKDSTLKRRDRILKNMYEDGYISESQYEKSVAGKDDDRCRKKRQQRMTTRKHTS